MSAFFIHYQIKNTMLDIQKKKSNSFFVLLSLPSTAMGFALSVQISALSWILSTKYGLDIHEIGIVWAAGPIAGIVAQPIVGLVSDKLWFMGGRRRPWIVVGSLLAALMLLALPNLEIVQKIFVSGSDPKAGLLTIAVIVALLLDLSINVSLNPTRSLVADCTTLEERSKGYTWMQTISGSFGMLAYFIGGTMGNLALIYIGAIITLLAAIIPAFLIEEPRHLANTEETKKEDGASTGKDILVSLFPLFGLLIYGIYVLVTKLFGITIPGRVHLLGMDLSIIEFTSLAIFVVTTLMVLTNALRIPKKANEYQKVLLAHSLTWVGVQTMFIYAFFFLSFTFINQKVELTPDTLDRVVSISDNVLTGIENDDPKVLKDIQFPDPKSNSKVFTQQNIEEIKDNLPAIKEVRGKSGKTNSMAFFILSLVSALLPAFVLNPIAERIGMVKTHYIAIFIMAIGYGGIFFIANTAILYYMFIAIAGIGWGSVVSLPFAIMSEKVDQTKMGLYMGIFNLSVVLPQLVASFKMGEVVNNAADKSIVFGICMITLAISGVLWMFVKNEKVAKK